MGGTAELAKKGLQDRGLYSDFVTRAHSYYNGTFGGMALEGANEPFGLPTTTVPQSTLPPFAKCRDTL